MDEDDEKDDCKRKTRNLSEKKRRDQFNGLVNELSSMVSSTSRKMDKSTVLKSTISFLKNHNEVAVRSKIHEIREDWKPSFLFNEEFTHLVLEALDGFIIVFSTNGRIFYASESITPLLGHLPTDLLNMSIYDLTYEEDHSDLYNMLLSPQSIVDPVQDCLTNENQICFSCHLKRGGLEFRNEITYELVEFTGYFRSDLDVENISLGNLKNVGFIDEAEAKVMFVGTSRLQKPQFIREMSIIGSTKSEFTSRLSLEWKFLFLDHRAPPIIGYLPFEVLGTSGYDYYHFDDLEQILLCHESLKQKGEGTSCFYRFLTKGQQWIWIQTRYYITYHQWTSKPEFVVCTHRVINYTDAMQQLRSNGKDVDDSNVEDSADSVERQMNTPASSSMMITNASSSSSSWSARRSRSRLTMAPSHNKSRQRHHTYHGSASDLTYLKCDTPSSRYFNIAQSNSKSMQRTISHSLKTSPQHHVQPMQTASTNSSQTPHTMSIAGPLQSYPPDAQQFLTGIAVQPVLATAYPSSSTAIIPPIPSQLPEIIHNPGHVMTAAQVILQDQLERKHEQLQQLIEHQQDELRRVSEQLLIARYGMVALPYTPVTSESTTVNLAISDHKPSPMHAHHHQQQQQQHHHNQQQPHTDHHHSTTHQLPSTHMLDLPDDESQHIATPTQQELHHYHLNHQQHRLSYGHSTVDASGVSTTSTDMLATDSPSAQSNTDEMISYMQLTPVTARQMSLEYSHLLLRDDSHMQHSESTSITISTTNTNAVENDVAAEPTYKMLNDVDDGILYGSTNTQSGA